MRHNLLIVEDVEGTGECPNVALMRCTASGALTGNELKDLIDKVVTRWRDTEQGRNWFEDSEEFNVRSLQHAYDNHSTLRGLMQTYGILNLNTEIMVADVDHTWMFHDQLGGHPVPYSKGTDQ